MNKKTIIIFLLIIFFCVGFLWNSIPGIITVSSNPEVNKAELILKNDRSRLEGNLKPETINDLNWINIKDYSINPKNLVNLKNARHLFGLTNNIVADLSICLQKDFCGMERRNENDSYFDQDKTPGHILLARSLAIMLECLRINPNLQDEIDWDLIRELTDSTNENIQVLAIELIKDFDVSGKETEGLLKIIDKYKGNAKAEALTELAALNSSNDRILFLDMLEKTFAIDDPNTVISVVEKMNEMKLSKTEVDKVSKNLCHYKENGTDDPNWKMIKYNMGKIETDLDTICTN